MLGSASLELGFIDHGEPSPFQGLSTSFEQQIVFSKQRLCLSSVPLVISWRKICSVSELECWTFVIPRHLLLRGLQHSPKKVTRQYRRNNTPTHPGHHPKKTEKFWGSGKTEMREFIFLSTLFMNAFTINILKLICIFQVFSQNTKLFLSSTRRRVIPSKSLP